MISPSTIAKGVIAKALEDAANARPSESDYAAIGKLALQHTALEYQLEALIWAYMGDVDKGHIATAKMGIQEQTDALIALVDWTEPDDGIAEAIEWAVKCFHTLRISRNSVIHGYNFKADQRTGKLFIEQRSKNIVFDANLRFVINSDVLQDLLGQQVRLSTYLYLLQRIIDKRGPEAIGPGLPAPVEPSPLPPKFPEPEKLAPLPHQDAKSARRQRQASLELENEAKKLERKARQRREQKPTA